MFNVEKFFIDEISALDANTDPVQYWGKVFVPGEDLFAFAEVDMPHDIVWVIGYSRGAPDMQDNLVFPARAILNARSFNYYKAKMTVQSLGEFFNGRTFIGTGYSVYVRADSIIPTPVHRDGYGRMTFAIEFYLEVRYE